MSTGVSAGVNTSVSTGVSAGISTGVTAGVSTGPRGLATIQKSDGAAPVTRKLVRAKIGPGGPLFAAKIGPTPDYFWLPKVVRVAKSGPGRLNCRNQFCILTIMTN